MSDDRQPLHALSYERRRRPHGDAPPTIVDRLVWAAACAGFAIVLIVALRLCVTFFALGGTAIALLFVACFLTWSYAAVMSSVQIGHRRRGIRDRRAAHDRRRR